MKLSNIQKKLNPKILEKGRHSFKVKCIYPFLWLFISILILGFFGNYLDTLPNGEDIFFYYLIFVSFLPNCIGIYFMLTDPYIKYHLSISGSLKTNIWGFRAFSKEELNFILKNFKKVKWKASLNIGQNLKDEVEIDNLKDKELEKSFVESTNFSEFDDLQMKKLQTMYYAIIGVAGVIIYSYINV